MSKQRRLAVACGLVAAIAIGVVVASSGRATLAQEPTPTGKGKRAQEFIAAFNKGDAKAVAGFWTPDGDYTDQLGNKYKGREALEKLYAKVFAANKGAKLSINVLSIKMLSPDVGIEEGINEVTPADGGPPTVGAFSAVGVKVNGEWYFQSVHESVAQPPSNAAHLEDLEWLLGDWAGEEKGESGTASYAWAENRNFIVSSFATTLNGQPVVGGTQWIGWDAVEKQVRSWSFYSGGGFGEAVWTRSGEKWSAKISAKTANGKKVTGTNTLTRVDADTATWQITNLVVDGKSVPDPVPQRLKRVKAK
jgi:uncharacterized protein (TIGR02246 family)